MSDSEHENEGDMIVDGEDEDRDDDESGGESSGNAIKEPRQVYLPGHQMQEDESLVFDPSAYHMLHDIDSGRFLKLADSTLSFICAYLTYYCS